MTQWEGCVLRWREADGAWRDEESDQGSAGVRIGPRGLWRPEVVGEAVIIHAFVRDPEDMSRWVQEGSSHPVPRDDWWRITEAHGYMGSLPIYWRR